MKDFAKIDTSPKADIANWTLRVMASAATLFLFTAFLFFGATL
jgi:hypothetical protein